MLCIKIENGLITQVVDSEKLPSGFVQVPNSFAFVSADVRYYDSNWSPKSEEALVAEGVIAQERTVYSTDTGEPRIIREFEVPDGYTPEAPEPGQVWDGASWITPPPAPPAVPRSITMRQARLLLHSRGLLTSVQEAIDSLDEPPRIAAQIEWDYSSTMERDKPFVAMIAGYIGLTNDDLDEMFIEAATL